MSFLKKKQLQPDAANDRLARTIATQIIAWQCLLAEKLNRRINRYSKHRQKWLLGIFCGISTGILILSLLVPFGKAAMKMPGHNYQPSHIGLPSDMPANQRQLKTTDSLTTKNK